MKKVLKIIDAISESSGKLARWLGIALILVMTNEVIMRYIFNSPTIWGYETAIMLGAAIYCLAYPYAQRHQAHVRVDVLYSRLSPRGKALIDVFGGILAFLPVAGALVISSWKWTINAWAIRETLTESFWYPPAYPLRTLIALGFSLLALQGLTQLFRDFFMVLRNRQHD